MGFGYRLEVFLFICYSLYETEYVDMSSASATNRSSVPSILDSYDWRAAVVSEILSPITDFHRILLYVYISDIQELFPRSRIWNQMTLKCVNVLKLMKNR